MTPADAPGSPPSQSQSSIPGSGLERVAQVCERACRVLGWIGIVLVSLLAFPIAYDAVARFLGHPTIWVFETSLYALVAAAFLANGIALSSGSHFRITFLSQIFPAWKARLDRCALLITCLFAAAFVYSSAGFVLYSIQFDIRSNTLLSIPQFLPQLALPVGGLALGMQAFAQLLRGQFSDGPAGEAIEAIQDPH